MRGGGEASRGGDKLLLGMVAGASQAYPGAGAFELAQPGSYEQRRVYRSDHLVGETIFAAAI